MADEIRIAFGGGGEALDERQVLDRFGSWVGDAGLVLYIPIAMEPPYDRVHEWVKGALRPSGIPNIAMATSAEQLVQELSVADAVVIGGGNTYALLDRLRRSGADQVMRRLVLDGLPVYGGSAGAILLGRDISPSRYTDPNDVGLVDTAGLDLALGYVVWCHYEPGDPRPGDYVRETGHSVIAIPERGGMVRIGDSILVLGPEPAQVFGSRNSESREPGSYLFGVPG